jgi:hypothetical protein
VFVSVKFAKEQTMKKMMCGGKPKMAAGGKAKKAGFGGEIKMAKGGGISQASLKAMGRNMAKAKAKA